MLIVDPFAEPEKYLSRLKQSIHHETRRILIIYLKALMASRCSVYTITTYINDFNAVLGNLNEKSLVDLTSEDFDEFIRFYSKGREHNTVVQRLVSVKRVYRYLLNSDDETLLITKSPIKKRMTPKMRIKNIPRHLERPEHVKVQIMADSLPLMKRAIFSVLDSGALRRSEVPRLKISDLDLPNNTMSVIGKANKKAIVTISKECSMILREWLKEHPKNTDALFVTMKGIPIRPTYVYRLTIELGKKAKISGRLNPHRIRHTVGTEMMSNNVPIELIRDKLRHSYIETTRMYTHVLEADLIAKYNKIMNTRR